MKYDPYGNRSVVNDAGTLLTPELATPQVSSLVDPSPFDTKNRWTGAQYDQAGQQETSWGNGSAVGSAKYFYDAEGKMKRAEV